MRMILFLAALAVSGAASAGEPTRLFSAADVIEVTLTGPINELARTAPRKIEIYPATLASGGETHAIELSARGNARRNPVNCDFPPLRVRFSEKPGKDSLFHKQGSLKLVTHCKRTASYQQYYLLEYAAYKLYEVLTPASFRVRPANVTYVDSKSGREIVRRSGFFIEDLDDVGDRVGLKEVKVQKVELSQHDAIAATRAILFFHMIGNHDWSMMSAGLESECCHNGKLLGETKEARAGLTYVPYDFDYSGFVGAPYAIPPDTIKISSVKKRYFRGSCMWNPHFAERAREFRAKKAEFYAAVAATPGLSEKSQKSANAYLDGFFKEIADDAATEKYVLKNCK